MDNFEFLADDIFGIYKVGIVFRGNVLQGKARTGDVISFEANGEIETGKIHIIELDRSIIEETVQGKELGILLNQFSSKEIESWDHDLPDSEEELENYPTTEERIGIKLPTKIWCAK